MKTITIEGFCKVIAESEICITDNGEHGEDLATFNTGREVNSGHRVWYMTDCDGYRVPITGLVKQNCSILLSLNTTASQLIADVMEIRLHCKPHEIKWLCDQLQLAQERIKKG